MSRSAYHLLVSLALAAIAAPLGAQGVQPKQVRLMVGFAAGGASDVTARMIAPRLAEALGTPFIVENRGGSGGLIATELVSKAAPDGSMLLLMPAADAVQPAVRSKLPYDLERDFAPVARIVTGPWFLVVHPSVPARSVKELVALARAQPKKLNYATSGVGSSAHLSALVFSSLAGIQIVHVPYKGTSDGVTATASGETDMIFASIPASKPLLAANRIRVLGVSTRERTQLAPEQPTLHESGVPGYDRSGWYGILAPAGVPRDYVTRLSATIAKVVDTKEMKEAFNRQGLEPATTTPEEFGRFIRAEVAQNVKVVKGAGVRID